MENYKNLGAGGTLNIVLSIIVAIVFVVGMWKMFVKAREAGWASIIPIYNIYVLFKITWGSGITFLLLLIPIVNIYIYIYIYQNSNKTSKSVWKRRRIYCRTNILNSYFLCYTWI